MSANMEEEEIEKFRDLFGVFDEDSSGRISNKELGTALRSLGQTITEAELQSMLGQADKDGDGTMDFEEFLQLMSGNMKDPDPEEDIREAFKLLDRDGNGYLSAKELRYVLTNAGEPLTDAEADNILGDADVDRDGRINFEEFVKMLAENEPR
eukprot:jgi/Tetstr1/436562/TSEL_002716.t1